MALTILIEVCVVSRLPPFRLISPSTVTSARVDAESIESVAPFSSVTVPPSTVRSAPFCRVSPAPPEEVLSNINGPSTVPPSVALTKRSTYALVAACKASVGSASNVRKPNIVSPSFDRNPSAPVAKPSHSGGTGSLAGELPPITSSPAIKEDEPAFTTSSFRYCVADDQMPLQRMPELNFCHLPAARSTLKSEPAACGNRTINVLPPYVTTSSVAYSVSVAHGPSDLMPGTILLHDAVSVGLVLLLSTSAWYRDPP